MAEPHAGSACQALDIAAEAARRAGLDATGAAVLRVRMSIHVKLPSADVVARIEGADAEHLASRQVSVARVLAERGAPTARLVRPEIQPLLIGDRAVTLWHRLRSVATPGFNEVGRAVRAMHEATLESLPSGVPAIDPFERVLACLDAPSPWSGSVEAKELGRRAGDLAVGWQADSRADPLGTVVVHGDAHIDNAIVTADGVVLLDLEDAGVGPASWDFAPLTVGAERYGFPRDDLDRFAAGYGCDPGTWPGYRLMCDVYELLVATWAIGCSATSSVMEQEARVRVAGLLDGDPTPWTLL